MSVRIRLIKEEYMGKEAGDVDEGMVVIASYTRREAIEDGVLIDVSEMAREAGFRCPVAMTSAAYGKYVAVPPDLHCQDESGRLWDCLWMLQMAIRTRGGQSDIRFRLYVKNDNREAQLIELKALSGPGDQGEHVITICLPNED